MKCVDCKSNVVLIVWIMTCQVTADINGDIDVVCPVVVSRSQWHASPSLCTEHQIFPVPYVIVMSTMSTANCSNFAECGLFMRNLQRFYMYEANMCDIPYTFVIAADGLVYEGVGWHTVGSHTNGYNADAVGVAFIGQFTDVLPTRAALAAFRRLLSCGLSLGELTEDYAVYAKRQFLPKSENPGDALFQCLKVTERWSASPFRPS